MNDPLQILAVGERVRLPFEDAYQCGVVRLSSRDLRENGAEISKHVSMTPLSL
jgi:hypothetical protein